MLDHLTLKVRDFDKAKAFYGAALKPLGYAVMMEFGEFAGLGAGRPDLWLKRDPDETRPTHVAFTAEDRAAVDAFYEAALAAGARDNGKPGVRTDYSPTYYAAFVLDPDGHNVEVVCNAVPGARASAKRARKPAASRKAARRPARKAKPKGRKARGRR